MKSFRKFSVFLVIGTLMPFQLAKADIPNSVSDYENIIKFSVDSTSLIIQHAEKQIGNLTKSIKSIQENQDKVDSKIKSNVTNLAKEEKNAKRIENALNGGNIFSKSQRQALKAELSVSKGKINGFSSLLAINQQIAKSYKANLIAVSESLNAKKSVVDTFKKVELDVQLSKSDPKNFSKLGASFAQGLESLKKVQIADSKVVSVLKGGTSLVFQTADKFLSMKDVAESTKDIRDALSGVNNTDKLVEDGVGLVLDIMPKLNVLAGLAKIQGIAGGDASPELQLDYFIQGVKLDMKNYNDKMESKLNPLGKVFKASSTPAYKTKIGSEVSRSDDAGQSPSVQWATATMQNQLSAITNGSASHIGSASLYAGVNNQPNASVNPNNTNNNQTQTGAQQAGYSTNTQAFQSSNWAMVAGNSATHMAEGNSFGSITAPNGGQLTSLNNSNKQYTLITKDFYVPVGVKQVTLTFNGNFVTNEYPTFVGSQFNDYASVKITSPSGNVTPVSAFNQTLNGSNFTTVNGLPSPLSSTGGQTGFKASSATIAVAGGGKVTVEVKVANVGDTAVPSAVLLNNITVK
jgi:hypothetical protein